MVTLSRSTFAVDNHASKRILPLGVIVFLFTSILIFSGCMENGGHSISLEDVVSASEEVDQEIRNQGATQASPAPSNNGLTTSHDSNEQSMEAIEVDDTDPAAVCLRFMQELHSGNKIAAENLLSRAALAVIGRSQFDLSPIGSEQSQIEIVDVKYASVKQEVAYVQCRVIDGEHLDETSTWLLKQQHKKWRISGMVESTNGGVPRMISFENPQDVANLQQ